MHKPKYLLEHISVLNHKIDKIQVYKLGAYFVKQVYKYLNMQISLRNIIENKSPIENHYYYLYLLMF